MRRLLPGLLLLLPLTLLGSRVFAGDPPKEDPAERAKKVAEARRLAAEDLAGFQARVNSAIDGGVAWLKTQQKLDGSFPAPGSNNVKDDYNTMDLGYDALVLLTLAKAGLTLDDKGVKRLEAWCRANYVVMTKGHKWLLVYPASVMILALDALYNRPGPEDPKAPSRERDRYGNVPGGGSTSRKPCKYPAAVAAWVQEMADFLKSVQVKNGGWRYPGVYGGAPPGDADLSNTQYALMALDVASRCGINVPLDVYMKALDYVLKEQDTDGSPVDIWTENSAWEPGLTDPPRWVSAGKTKMRGWFYSPDKVPACKGSMTCGGVSCLAIVKERVGEAGKLTPELGHKIDHGMLDGLAWLGEAFTVTTNPVVPEAPAMWQYYYLYGLERVGALTGVKYLGKSDWYREGADHLIGAQEKNGSWMPAKLKANDKDKEWGEMSVPQTCFALLFLKRATAPPAVPVTPPMLTGAPDVPSTDGRAGMDGDDK